MSLQNRKQELMSQIDRVMTACTLTPDQVVICISNIIRGRLIELIFS